MDHVPVEVLHEIFIRLDLKNRLQCMTVCRYWYDILDRRSLLHTVDISRSRFLGFKDMVERHSYRGAQVTSLRLEIDSEHGFDKRKLYNMFPNLQELYLKNGGGTATEEYMNKPFHFNCSVTKLETIGDFGECELTCQLAFSNLCNGLKSLVLNFCGTSYSMTSSVISQLKNMPVLETLSLESSLVGLMDIEILHENLPSMKELTFYELELQAGEIPQNITPASLITELVVDLESAENLEVHVEIYKYISMKYPSVSRPETHDREITNGDPYYVKLIYTLGILPMYQNIASKIDSFEFVTFCNGMDAFSTFDEFGMKLKVITIKSHDDNDLFMEELAQSDQANYIQSLDLFNIVPRPMLKLRNMKALKRLYINDGWREFTTEKKIDLGQLIEACPDTLSALSIVCCDFKINQATSNLTSITYLNLRDIELTLALAKVLEAYFPKLLELKLRGLLSSDLTISLSNHHLEKVDIRALYKQGQSIGFSTKTTNDGQVQYHASRPAVVTNDINGRSHTYSKLVPVSEESFNEQLVLNFICASVEKLHLFPELDIYSIE
jgi:hypothetical protein